MAKPFWQYFAVEEQEGFVLSEEQRLISFVIMMIAFVIVSVQMFYIISKIRNESSTTGSRVQRNYIIMYLGIYLTFMNSVFLRISIFLTDGQYSVFAQEKGVLFFAGTTIFVYGLTQVAFSIIDFRKRTKTIITLIFYIFLVIGVVVLFVQSLIILGQEQYVDLVLLLETISAALASTVMLIFIVALFFEARSDPSKIEQLRLNLLSIATIFVIIIFLVIGVSSPIKDAGNAELFVTLTTYIIPTTYLFAQPLMFMIFFWSLLTPNWLLIKAGVIQPSFKEFLARKKREKEAKK